MIGGSEPPIIPAGTPNAEFWYNDQLQQMFQSMQNLFLTSRDGAIQNTDKAGNLSAVYAVFTSNAVANTEDAVAHVLGRTPLGYFVVSQNKAGTLYDSTTAATGTTIYWKSSVASVAWVVLVF